MLWQVNVFPKPDQPLREVNRLNRELQQRGISQVQFSGQQRGFLIQGAVSLAQANQIAKGLLTDLVIEDFEVLDSEKPPVLPHRVHVLLKPGVMDPVAQSCLAAIRNLEIDVDQVRTFRSFDLNGPVAGFEAKIGDLIANEAIETARWGTLGIGDLDQGAPYEFQLNEIALRQLNDDQLLQLSRDGQLSLTLTEMKTIQQHYLGLGRDATDAELETIAQTWSEHCSHKTLRGKIAYREFAARGELLEEIHFENLLSETIAQATRQIRAELGSNDWCVSVFKDNAGIVRFEGEHNICFKVETHNHPSAIEPYGGANTGIGGVIRDILGTGLGAKPIANTDVFCFAPPDFALEELPANVIHPRRMMEGVVAGVRDYGNRMGIPTVNGAIFFDPRYLGNPLVYCGTVGLIPQQFSDKQPGAGDLIVSLGGRTGRDGIHGATFSSIALSEDSEALSGGAVQIGNPIEEKKVADVLLEARDRQLYSAVTDCGAGGFSSAVGEMGEEIGAEVWLEMAPLKYQGLSYTEIWISEAQERMVLAVPEQDWPQLHELCSSEDVEATVIGRFEPTGNLLLKYEGEKVGELAMDFLHNGRPPVVREARFQLPAETPLSIPPELLSKNEHWAESLLKILGNWNVCSKEWVIRQYDHEVQGASVIKPLVGEEADGPSDGAVLRPLEASMRGVVLGCGCNPRFGDVDPYWMAAGAIDESIRNCVALGADPGRIAILDNFCWGNTERPDQLGTLVRAAIGCGDIATKFRTPFISGKDSLNNEFVTNSGTGQTRIVIPPTLLISAVGQIDDVRRAVTMDLKSPGNHIVQIGETFEEFAGSHYCLVNGLGGGTIPKLNAEAALRSYRVTHGLIKERLVRSCHDLSEGGLAAALAEMAFAGGWGVTAEIDRSEFPIEGSAEQQRAAILFAESNARLLIELAPEDVEAVQSRLQTEGIPFRLLGRVVRDPVLSIIDRTDSDSHELIHVGIDRLKSAWKQPLAWNE